MSQLKKAVAQVSSLVGMRRGRMKDCGLVAAGKEASEKEKSSGGSRKGCGQ